jgi:two-component system sensor histidine kinase/response regulator
MADISERAPGPPRHILLAEDNAVSQRVVTAMLENLGFRVDLVTDGANAVRAATLTAYDAILMDCQIPVLDGFRASSEIRRLQGVSRHTPIIAVTASPSSDSERCLAAGMDACLGKPLSLRVLTTALACWAPDEAGRTAALDSAAFRPVGPEATECPDRKRTVLDLQILDRLKRLGEASGEDLIGQLATLFLTDAQSRIVAMRRALAAADTAILAGAAHTLSGSSANLGATDLARLSADLERHASAHDLIGGTGLLDGVEVELERVRSALSLLAPMS